MDKNEELRLRLRAFMEEYGVSQSEITRLTGFTSAKVSLFLSGAGLNVNNWFKVSEVLDREEATRKRIKEPA